MKRIHAFEWEDQPWFPSFLRQYMTDFLRFIFVTGNLYKPVTTVLIKGLSQTGSKQVIDLCSGAGGAIETVQKNLFAATAQQIPFVLTDLFPNLPAYEELRKKSDNRIRYSPQPVNAASVPSSLRGFRTVFSGFHHFEKETAVTVLQNAVNAGEGIAVFDGGNKSIWFMLLILLFQPFAFLLFTPFIRPFSLRRLIFTYLIPAVPFCTIWDGIASVLRLYTTEDMFACIQCLKQPQIYHWETNVLRNAYGIKINYLLGFPRTEN